MIGAGFVLFAGALVSSNRSLPFTVGLSASLVPNAVLAHLVLAFPDGRLHSIWERLLVGAAYLNAVVLQIVMLMFMGIGNVGGCPCPTNLLFVSDNMGVHMALMKAERLAGVPVAAGVAVVIVARWLSASSLLRRALAPILVAGGATSVLLGVLLLSNRMSVHLASGLQSAEQVTLATVPLAYLFGLFRARMARGGVSELVVELGRAPEQGRLRDALARALRDPTLELGYWIPESGEYVDVDGRAVSANPPARRAVTILERRGEKVAALVHDAALRENPSLLDAVSSAAGLALENERLLADLRSQLEQTRESRARIVGAGDAERRRLERNLHDGAQQRLVAVSLQMGRAAGKIEDDPQGAAALLETTRGELGLALEELRELARGIHPAVLTERGLLLALKSLAARAPIPVRVAADLPARLSAPLEAAVYYVVAEALTNTAKYANAKTASVELTCENGRVNVLVHDDGVGGADPRAGSGLRGLRDRIEAFDGSLTVTSPRNGGTLIDVDLPLQVLDGEAA